MDKWIVIFSLFIFCGCGLEEDSLSLGEISNCGLSTFLDSPEGYSVNPLGGLEISTYRVKDFHYLDNLNGFLISHDFKNNQYNLQRTEDGGVSWEILNLPSSNSLKNLVFKNGQEGSLFTFTSEMLFTEDGGNTWQTTSTQKGLNHYSFAENSKLYASDYDDNMYVSSNDGESWTLLSNNPEFDFSRIDFSFKIIGDKIFALGKDDKLIVINLEGEYLYSLNPGISSINNIHVLNESTFIVSAYDRMVLTTDGGQSFSIYYDGVDEMIAYHSLDKAVMVIKTGGSTGDGFYTCDEIAHTIDGGATWIYSGSCIMNLVSSITGTQTMSNERSVAFFRNCIYEIKPS